MSNGENSSFGAIRVALGIGMMLMATAVTLVAFSLFQSSRKPRDTAEMRNYKLVDEFQLTSQSGQPFTREQLKGKVWIANFIFTSCAAECLVLSKRMGEVQNHFTGNTDVAFVSISVDPHTDNPERLADYAKKYGADERWTFLTGPVRDVDALIKKSFLLPVARDDGERSEIVLSNFIHSDRIAVVDRAGMVRYYVDGMRPEAVSELTRVIRVLLAEPAPK